MICDPGVQPERTALAWGRTGLAVTVNAVLVLRAGLMTEYPWLVALAIVLFLAAAGAMACGSWRARQLRSPARPAATAPWLIAATVAVALLACVAALASIIVAPY